LVNFLLSLLLGESEVGDPLSALGVLLDESWLLGDDLSGTFLSGSRASSGWVGDDGGVHLLVDVFDGLDLVGGEALVPLGELDLESLGVLLLELVHVNSDVVTVDSVSMLLGVEVGLNLLGIVGLLTSLVDNSLNLSSGVTWESLGVVWHVDTSVTCTLEDTEDSGTGGGSVETNIEKSLEWSLVLDVVVDVEVLSVDVGVDGVHVGEVDLLEESSGEEETGGVAGGVVGKTGGESMSSKFSGVSLAQNSISGHGGVDNLSNDLSVSSSGNKSVFLGVILVLVLLDQSSSGVVVSLALSSSFWLDLHSL